MNEQNDTQPRREVGAPTETSGKIEALLFALSAPLSRKELTSMLGCSAADLEAGINTIREGGDERGIVLIDDGATLELRVSSNAAALVEKIRKEEYEREVGKAGLEALAAILYRGPLSRAEIDFIRGVNSSQTLRTLTMRGLVRRVPNPKDARGFLYEPTTELLAQMGVANKDELPEFEHVREKLAALEEAYRAKETDA